jgi:hypothetical protein
MNECLGHDKDPTALLREVALAPGNTTQLRARYPRLSGAKGDLNANDRQSSAQPALLVPKKRAPASHLPRTLLMFEAHTYPNLTEFTIRVRKIVMPRKFLHDSNIHGNSFSDSPNWWSDINQQESALVMELWPCSCRTKTLYVSIPLSELWSDGLQPQG